MTAQIRQAWPAALSSVLKAAPLPVVVRWGVIAVALLDWSLNVQEPVSPFERSVHIALMVIIAIMAWRQAWGALLLIALVPVLSRLEYSLAPAVAMVTMVALGTSTCTRPVAVAVVLGSSAWLTGGYLSGNLQAGVAIGLQASLAVTAAVGLTLRQYSGDRRRDRARVAQLEKERAEIIEAERRAIARELHDVVAHAVSVIAVQARAAKFDQTPNAAHTALDQIGDLSREALSDLRRLLRVLASDRDPSEDSSPAEWNVFELRGQLISLVDTMTSLGIQVDVDIPSEDLPLPRSVATAVYRIAQEATTNVIKHAGPEATCRFHLSLRNDRVELTVHNCPVRPTSDSALSSGFGLDSMRERVHMFDGTLTAGQVDRDGWQVHAVVPLRM